MGKLRKIRSLQSRLPASTFNELVAQVEEMRKQLSAIDDERRPRPKSTVLVQLIWDADDPVEPGNCVKLGIIADDPTYFGYVPFSGLTLHADKYDAAETPEKYAITLEPIEGGGSGVGFGFMPNATWAKVDITDAGHTKATIDAAGTLLASSATAGQLIVWKPSGTGEKWCVVQIGGGIIDHYQIVRGTSVGEVADSDPTFTIENLIALEANSTLPDSPLTVTNQPAEAHTTSDPVYAIYREETDTWEALPGAGASTPALRMFVLTATKTLSQDSATVKWLDHAGTAVGGDVTVYDPDQRFAGQIADYVSGEAGFHGLALLRADLAESEPGSPRYEIIAMERYAEWAVVEWNESPDNFWTLRDAADNFGGDEWNNRRPVANAGQLTIIDPLGITADAADGQLVIARLTDPDTLPPTYQAIEIKLPDKYVIASPADTSPSHLAAKHADSGTYDAEVHAIVSYEVVDLGSGPQLRLFTPILDGGEGGVEVFAANIAEEIAAGTAETMAEGTGTVYSIDTDGTTTSIGTKAIFNPWGQAAIGNCAVLPISEDNFVYMGGGGGSGEAVAAVGVAYDIISARSGSSPGSGTVTILKSNGSPSTTWYNYSSVTIPSGTYLGAIEIGGDMVIFPAWC